MNARTRLLAIPAALVLALALVACGSAPTGEPAAEPADVIEDVELSEDEDVLDEFDEEDDSPDVATQRIGTPEFGFTDVPSDYVEFRDVSGGTDLQYADVTGTSIITLNVFDLESVPEDMRDSFTLYDAAQSVAANIDQGGPTDIQGATVELAGRTAYQVYAFFEDGTFLVTWVVDDPDGVIHYVAVEGPADTILDNVELVEETYAFDA